MSHAKSMSVSYSDKKGKEQHYAIPSVVRGKEVSFEKAERYSRENPDNHQMTRFGPFNTLKKAESFIHKRSHAADKPLVHTFQSMEFHKPGMPHHGKKNKKVKMGSNVR